MDKEMSSIFEQIKNLKVNAPETKPEKGDKEKESTDSLKKLRGELSEEIQRVLNENNYTQEDVCSITGMSQSNISKILNGKVAPRIETLQKIASATNTKLTISFEQIEGGE